MGPLAPPRKVGRPALAALLALLLILAATPGEMAAEDAPQNTPGNPASSFWHYAVAADGGNPPELAWPKPPSNLGLPGVDYSFMVQRWPNASMPDPGEAGWITSKVDFMWNNSNGSYSGADTSGEAAAAGGAQPPAGGALPYYRILALNITSENILAATSPSRPLRAQGTILVSQQPCTIGPCLRLAQQPSLQAAVAAAQPGNTIAVLPGNYTVVSEASTMQINKTITLLAVAGPKETTIDCNDTAPAFRITAAAAVHGFRIISGPKRNGGCAIIADSSPIISNCQFIYCGWHCPPSQPDNCELGIGGALMVTGPSSAPAIRDSYFAHNTAVRGGAIYVGKAAITIERCSFWNNTAQEGVGVGGAIMFDTAVAGGSVIRDTNITGGRAGFSGGGIAVESTYSVRLERTKVRDNLSSSHAAGALIFASSVDAVDSEFVNNSAASFGGALLAQFGTLTATRTRFIGNVAKLGGAAIKLYSASAILIQCTVSKNAAMYGGGIEVARIPGLFNAMVSTSIDVQNSIISENFAQDRGAGVFVESADAASITNTTISNNHAASQGGGIFCSTLITLTGSRVMNNSAPTGGGILANTGCNLQLSASTLITHNSATLYGAGLAVSDGAQVVAVDTNITGNGVKSCNAPTSPLAGGGIFVGVENFNSGGQCLAPGLTPLAVVYLGNVHIDRNSAREAGGGVYVAAGNLTLENGSLAGNAATGGGGLEGAGGAVALQERCPEEVLLAGVCGGVTASLLNATLTANAAAAAGGAVFFGGNSSANTLLIRGATVEGNSASAALQGMGGGLFLGHPNFSVNDVQLRNNSAYYGGALCLSADLSTPQTIQRFSMTGNTATGMGDAVFWLYDKAGEGALELACPYCSSLAAPGDLATEMRELDIENGQPSTVPTSQPIPPFTVVLKDAYGSRVTTANGMATLLPAREYSGLDILQPEALLMGGKATFSMVQFRGTINATYDLKVSYSQAEGRTSMFLPPPGRLDTDPFTINITPCPAGSQPNADNNTCSECSVSTFNLDGSLCLPCPKGATCMGGAAVSTAPDFWRATAASSSFHSCKARGVCLATNATGDEACREGQRGPLCDVCWKGYFKYTGTCRECEDSSQAIAMLVVLIIVFVLMTVALFARSWEFGNGPGVMTKIKIFLWHFQIIALFRDYDVVWPGATNAALSWFELANVGFVLLAPECFFGAYNFYMLYVFQMLLPFLCVGLCVAVFYGAELALIWADPYGVRQEAGTKAPGMVGWLMGLKIRCWHNAFWFVTLLYPRSAMTALQLFGWQHLETGTYLHADYSIMVKLPDGRLVGTFVGFLVPGVILLVIVAALIPAFWFVTVYRNRHKLEDPLVQAKYGFLYSSYSPRLPYWETAEMLRKFAISCIPVFVPVQVEGSLQAAVGQAVLLLFIMLTVCLLPFAEKVDNWLMLASMIVLWLLLLTAGVNKWANLSPAGSRALAGVQLAMSSGVGFVLGCAVVLSAIKLARRLSRQLAERRKEREAARASFASSVSTVSGGRLAGYSGGEVPLRIAHSPGAHSTAASSRRGSAASPGLGVAATGDSPTAAAPAAACLKRGSGGSSSSSTTPRGSFLSTTSTLKRGSSSAPSAAFLSALSSFKRGGSSSSCLGSLGCFFSADGEINAARASTDGSARDGGTKPGGTQPTVVVVNASASAGGEAPADGARPVDAAAPSAAASSAAEPSCWWSNPLNSPQSNALCSPGPLAQTSSPLPNLVNGPGPLLRTASSMSRRSAADDLEMQLAVAEVGNMDGSRMDGGSIDGGSNSRGDSRGDSSGENGGGHGPQAASAAGGYGNGCGNGDSAAWAAAPAMAAAAAAVPLVPAAEAAEPSFSAGLQSLPDHGAVQQLPVSADVQRSGSSVTLQPHGGHQGPLRSLLALTLPALLE